MPRYQEHDILVSQDVPNQRLNALVMKYQARGMVVHVMLDLPKEPNMEVRTPPRPPALARDPAGIDCIFLASFAKPGTCARL